MRRRKASPASRLRPFWILAIFIAILSAFAGYFVVTSPVFRPRAISVSSNRIVSRSDIVARAAIAGDRNIWMQNTRAMVSRIETIPYIATAAVHRHLDGTVSIDVTERIPFAVVETHGERAI
ncbi:MAG: FtsQ-type POTRA domain-containing protein, partial [Candidatus Baltobacteraceae bacterium]